MRPEWGLAGAAWFIAAPRALTRSLDLGGRAFLHSYEQSLDPQGEILELILTAPMVVASWIAWQYFASTTNNRVFGAGEKTLHNVVGALGVIEGNAGDLRVGLARQSVHDGKAFTHEPVRLQVLLAASLEAIEGVLARRADVRDLVDNGWVRLHRTDDEGRLWRRTAPGQWTPAPR